MIAYLEGSLLKKEEDRIILLVQQVGYEIFLPVITMEAIKDYESGRHLSLYIYYHQTERQPRPLLIGFKNEREKEFFQFFVSVEDIGPVKAMKALSRPVSDIVSFIEAEDIKALSTLKGIGKRTAQKIVATLMGKLTHFIDDFQGSEDKQSDSSDSGKELSKMVFFVLVEQMGHKPYEAEKLISQTLKRNPEIKTPEALLEHIYKNWSPGGSDE